MGPRVGLVRIAAARVARAPALALPAVRDRDPAVAQRARRLVDRPARRVRRVHAADPGALAFWREWLSVGIWPSGPLWFIGLLLEFDVIVAVMYRFAPVLIERAGRLTSARLTLRRS